MKSLENEDPSSGTELHVGTSPRVFKKRLIVFENPKQLVKVWEAEPFTNFWGEQRMC